MLFINEMNMHFLWSICWALCFSLSDGLPVRSVVDLHRDLRLSSSSTYSEVRLTSMHSGYTSTSSQQQLRMAAAEDGGIIPGDLRDIGVVLLAGGKGKRMKANVPKQFLEILGKPVFLRSLEIFTKMRCVTNIVIVLDESYRSEYSEIVKSDPRISWADPGLERQGSVFNGLSGIPETCSLVAVHDSARPLVTQKEVEAVLQDAGTHGAAVLGVPVKATIKESEDGAFVLRTVEVNTISIVNMFSC